MTFEIHEFDNGVKVYRHHLIPEQIARYRIRNVHEAEEEEIFVDLVSNALENGCYVNIGAAIGYYPILAKKLRPDLIVYAFEPLEKHRGYLSENLSLNDLTPSDVVVRREAVSSGVGLASFVHNDYGSGIPIRGNTQRSGIRGMIRAFWRKAGAGGEPAGGGPAKPVSTVETTSIDAFIHDIGRPLDLVQMDVQGHERDVLAGGIDSLRGRRIGALLIGTHGRHRHRECAKLLRRCGYRVTVDSPDTREQPDGILVARAP